MDVSEMAQFDILRAFSRRIAGLLLSDVSDRNNAYISTPVLVPRRRPAILPHNRSFHDHVANRPRLLPGSSTRRRRGTARNSAAAQRNYGQRRERQNEVVLDVSILSTTALFTLFRLRSLHFTS